jgi:CRISPR-associated protein (TIGR02584 family)
MAARPYNLLVAVGKSPQVITETICELYRTTGEQPAAVHAISTRIGAASVRALLLGEDVHNPLTGDSFSDAADRWTPFCEDVLKRPPVPIECHVPQVDGAALDDIRRRGDDTCFSDLCYERVERLTRPDQLPLVGSIAGGRKTMSAHLMTAFSVYARPDDRLTHVLITRPELEHDPSFFYPTPGTPDFAHLLDLVDVKFPRLRPVLQSDVIDALPDDRRDLQGILAALEPHVVSVRKVTSITLELRDATAQLAFTGTEGSLDTCVLTPKQAATLLTFAEARGALDSRVPAPTLIGEEVEARRAAVASLCAQPPFTAWQTTTDVSKAISDLNDALARVPIADRTLRVEGISSQPRRYDWPEPPPAPLTVATPYPDEDWPFEHLPELEPLDRR